MVSEYWYIFKICALRSLPEKYVKSQISLHMKSLNNVQSSYSYWKTCVESTKACLDCVFKTGKKVQTSSQYCTWVWTSITHLTFPVSGLLPLLPDLSAHLLQIPGISFRLAIQSAHGLPAMLLVYIHWVRCTITLQFICLKTGWFTGCCSFMHCVTSRPRYTLLLRCWMNAFCTFS